MRIAVESYRGEAPRLTPRALPENGAQIAKNARLQSGDLEAWRQFLLTKALSNGAFVNTIYLLNDQWLSWSVDVDVARGAIAGDTSFRIYLTGPDLYNQPRFTNYTLATTGAEPFPVVTRPLGVPGPDAQPTLVAGVSSLPSESTIEVLDNGDQLTTAWTASPTVSGSFTLSRVSQSATEGNGPPSYYLEADENTDSPVYLYRNFGVGDSQTIDFSFDVKFGVGASNGGQPNRRRMQANILASTTGAGIGLFWAENGFFSVGIAANWRSDGFSTLSQAAIGAPAAATQYTCQGSIQINAAGTKTVRAAIYNGSAQIGATVTVTNAFVNSGGNFGFVLHLGDDAVTKYETWYDNILVRGSSPTAALTQIATSYVYTFVNDIGEESAPSPASATTLKDDGTAITVTSATAVPSGFSVDYGVATKRIYRAVTGNTGTVFRFVAEIPLAQADYVDELTDSELGDVLETDDWDLPPDDLRGILALPNGVMVGFSKNQLCFSPQNHPHAWPVRFRLNTDTDIVAIGNIDTTVVVGTEAFPYTATGNDPAAYSMTKLEVPQACVAKRSLAYLTGIGVVFASPDGLIAVSGNGRVSNLTESVFTRRQWQALQPETVLGLAHDDVYHFWYGSSGYRVSLDFEGANGSQTFFDDGSAHSIWTASSSVVTLSTSAPLSGGSSLSITSATAYLSTTATEQNMLPADEDWDMTFRARATSWLAAGATGVYLFSIQDTTASAAGTQFVVATDQFRQVAVVLSDGVTRSIVVLTTFVLVDGVGYAFEITRRGAVVSLRIDGVERGTGVFTGSLNQPTNRQIRIGQPEIGTQVGALLTLDTVRILNQAATGAGYALDMKNTGFGLIELSYHARATHADPLTDKLYLVLDSIDEPSEPYLPVESTLPTLTVPYQEIFEFDSEGSGSALAYRWKGKLNRLAEPTAFLYCQVKAGDYVNLILNLYANRVLMFSQVITGEEPFTLPNSDDYETFEIELIGTSRVEAVRVAESIEELELPG